MANKSRIKAMAKELNLQTIVDGQLKELAMSNLDYLELVFKRELDSRKRNAIARVRSNSNLPQVEFNREGLNDGLRYQVEKLLGCDWVNDCGNLVIIDEPNTEKTALATYLASNAIEKGFRVFYIKVDDVLNVMKQKEVLPKASATFNKIKNADILVLDEMLYLDITKENLELLYKTVMFLNDTTSIVFVANREISEWLAKAEDKYAMRLLVARAIENAELIKLRKP